MRFVLRMVWREMRASWTRLFFFFLCVALGVAAIVVLRSVAQNVRTTLVREARNLVGADLIVQSNRPLDADQQRKVDDLLNVFNRAPRDQRAPIPQQRTSVVETQTMAMAGAGIDARVRLVEVRAVEAGFPFYGAIEMSDGQVYSHALLEGHGALIQPELATSFNVKNGDVILLAGKPFTIRGVVTKDQVQRGTGFAFGPRVYVDLTDLRATSLLGFGSRATHELFVRMDDRVVSAAVIKLRDAFERDVVTVRSWRTVEDRLGRNLTLAENYLSLVGFAIVVLGGIGVWSVTRVLVQQKIRSVAILKCLGATSGRVLAIYVLQVVGLAACGSALGVGVAAAVVAAIPSSVLVPLGVTHASITISAALQGLAVGLLVSLLFAVVPLLEVRHVKPLLLLRTDLTGAARRRDWRVWLTGALTGIALALVAAWQADSLKAGLYVSGGLAGVGLVLALASRLIVWAVKPLARSRRFALRHAVLSLGRPGNQTRVILMAVGIGCFFILSVRAMQSNLLAAFDLERGNNAPDFVLIDVQLDQVAGVTAVMQPYVRTPPRLLPILRARVVGVDGARLNLPTAAAVRDQGGLTREFGLTYRAAIEDNEKVVAGTFWTGALPPDAVPEGIDTEVSIEEEVHNDQHIDVGDLMRFDVAGRLVRARVTSVRKVSWDQSQNGGFVFVLRPAPIIDRTARSFIGFVQGADDPKTRTALQRDLAKGFPNVSVIDVRDVISSIKRVIDNATLGVTIVGGVTLAGGVLILIGAVAMTKFQRLYESAIYRTLGASTRLLFTMTAVEYGLLGLLAGLIGAGGALGLSWVVARELFEIEWHATPGLLAAGVGLAGVVVSAVGLLSSADVLVRKPLGTLRGE